MTRIQKLVTLTFAILFLAGCAVVKDPDAGSDKGDPSVPGEFQRIVQRCQELWQLCDSSETPEEMEEHLLDAELCVIVSTPGCPEYLENSKAFRTFWESPARNGSGVEVVRIKNSGTLSYRFFTWQDSVPYVYHMQYDPAESDTPYYQYNEILDWSLTEKGNFFYQIYPADDSSYADYFLLRLNQPDPELWELYDQYLLSGAYVASNLYLTNWSEENWGELCFNDAWEYFCHAQSGQQFKPHGHRNLYPTDTYAIPTEEFENVIFNYFQIAPGTLRELAQYDEGQGYYPWRKIESIDYFYMGYYTIEPEVAAYTRNSDGTLTLTIEVLCTDLKMDCVFSHALTVRPLGNGRFKYVANQILTQTEYGLPYCEPRLTWEWS